MKQFRSYAEAREALAAKSKFLHEIFEAAGPDLDLAKVSQLSGDNTAKAAEIKRLNTELAEIGKERDEWHALEQARASTQQAYRDNHEPVGVPLPGSAAHGEQARPKSLGDLFVTGDGYRQYVDRGILDVKTVVPIRAFQASVMRTGAGIATESTRIDDLLQKLPSRAAPFVLLRIPQRTTEQAAIKYLEQTTRTNNAAEFAEATSDADTDIIGEAALAYTERTQNVEAIGVWLPVTEQQLKFQPEAAAEVDEELPLMVMQRIDSQVLVGNGTTPNLLGTNSVSGIQTQAKGADPTFDAFFKLFRAIRADGFAEPSVAFVHPNDWQDIRLARTADGIYILGNPTDPGPERIWGVPVDQTTAATENTATCGDYARFSRLYWGGSMEVSVTNSHRRHFTRLMLAVRAVVYASMVHLRPKAFGTVTGI